MSCRCGMKLISPYLSGNFSSMSELLLNIMVCHRLCHWITIILHPFWAPVSGCWHTLISAVVPLDLQMEELSISSWGRWWSLCCSPPPRILNFKTIKILHFWCLSRTAFYSLSPLELWSNYASTQLSVRQNSCWLSWAFVQLKDELGVQKR